MDLEKLVEGLKIGVKSALSNLRHLSSRIWAAVAIFAILSLVSANNWIIGAIAVACGVIAVGMAYSDKEDSEALEEEMANKEAKESKSKKTLNKADDSDSSDEDS